MQPWIFEVFQYTDNRYAKRLAATLRFAAPKASHSQECYNVDKFVGSTQLLQNFSQTEPQAKFMTKSQLPYQDANIFQSL